LYRYTPVNNPGDWAGDERLDEWYQGGAALVELS
jgi:hypothetical protein